jgi:ATP-binding cassette, subfamily B, bacterial
MARPTATTWYRTVIQPRLSIVQLLPCAGAGLIAALVATNVIVGLLPVAFVVTTSLLIGLVPAAMSAGRASSAFADLMAAFLTAAACFLAQQVLAPFQNALGERVKRRVDGRLRDECVSVVMKSTSIAPLEEHETVSALSEVTRLFEIGWNSPGMACAGLVALVARYVRLMALLMIVASVASLPVALGVGAVTLLFRYGQRGGLRKYSAVWREVAGINRRSQYLLELAAASLAAKEIRIFGLLDWLKGHYSQSFLAAYAPVAARRREIYRRPYLFFTPLGVLVASWAMVELAMSAASGQISLTAMALGLQATVLALLLGEFYPESDVATQFGMQAVAALDEVRERIEAHPAHDVTQPAQPAPEQPGPVRFEDVHFGYPGASREILSGLTLELQAGKCTALVGANGAGKTTLVKLLTRLYEPTSGSIRAPGCILAQVDPQAWRRQVSVVFQDFVRYELSVADNIALGAAHAPLDRAAVESAARDAGILDALAKHPLGLDTPLGRGYTGGIDLSGGEWQRVAIARSLYALRKGATLLILDEPTSALDVRAEAAFFDRFVELTHGATSLLISHRFSSVRRADHIVVLDQGRVIEQGTHQELLALGNHYATMFKLQADRFTTDSAPRAQEPHPYSFERAQPALAEGVGS